MARFAAAVAEQHQNVNVTGSNSATPRRNGLPLQGQQWRRPAPSVVTIRCNISFYWYDDAGQEVASDGRGWTPQVAWLPDPHLSALAPSPAARGYRFAVREVMEESY